MWKVNPNFITLHYGWIGLCTLVALPVLYPYGNLEAADVFFFGASGSTQSGLNTVDVKDLKTYQQVFLYVVPTITNMVFLSIAVVVVRLYWFRRRLTTLARTHDGNDEEDGQEKRLPKQKQDTTPPLANAPADRISAQQSRKVEPVTTSARERLDWNPTATRQTTIAFDRNVDDPYILRQEAEGQTLRVPGPRQRDAGYPLVEVNTAYRSTSNNEDAGSVKPGLQRTSSALSTMSGLSLRRPFKFNAEQPGLTATRSVERVATSIMALGHTPPPPKPKASKTLPQLKLLDLPHMNRHVTVGRNSQFHNLTSTDREILGGIEYRALKLLLKFVVGYFFGLHLLGVVCLLPWIHHAPQKYLDWLEECGIGKTWWALYSAQTMANNLGFTLTPDSMATFKDATWPMLCMTFMAFAGHTFYPVFLRLALWVTSKLVPKDSGVKEDLRFLLDHPRRCYTLLFPSKPTWLLGAILFILNFVDVLLIIVLDLDNPAVNDLPMGPRILSAMFQAASARHCGTSTLSLASVNPAVQFSLLAMMYIAVFPIAISIRASNTYEEKSLGLFEDEQAPDETSPRSYVMSHIRKQLSFDLWYIFLGTFVICIAEAERIMDETEPAFSVFPVVFECTSAYANVGLSLGHPIVSTSFAGQFTTFSKVVLCLMMIRGRHRMLPYALDRAIMVPADLQPVEKASLNGDEPMSTAQNSNTPKDGKFEAQGLDNDGSRHDEAQPTQVGETLDATREGDTGIAAVETDSVASSSKPGNSADDIDDPPSQVQRHATWPRPSGRA